jgi:hypothetical protein
MRIRPQLLASSGDAFQIGRANEKTASGKSKDYAQRRMKAASYLTGQEPRPGFAG